MRNGPRAAASWRRARSSVCATGPTLPPSASATATPGNLPTDPMPRSGFVVLLLFLLGLGAGDDEVLFREVGSHHLVVAHFLDRLFFLDVDRLDDLGFPLAAGGLAGGGLMARGVLLVGPALRAGGLGFSEIIELRATVVALEFGSQLELRHCALP